MLDVTLATEFVPGTNLKGEVAGANWTFLLPDLELDRIVALGEPSRAALTTLLRLGQVTIVCDDDSHLLPLAGDESARNHPGVEILTGGLGVKLACADDSVDLVFVCGDGYRKLVPHNEHLLDEVKRILKPDGVLFFEPGGLIDRAFAKRRIGKLAASFGVAKTVWLSPLVGECHTAVPVESSGAIAYFLDRRLYSPSITGSAVKGIVKRIQARWTNNQSRTDAKEPIVQRKTSLQKRFPPVVRSMVKGGLRRLADVERMLLKHVPFLRRYGVYLGSSLYLQHGRLPRYLRQLASDAGVEIVDYFHWGVVARGDYSSRKVLFFLFAGDRKHADEMQLAFVVKMVRDPRYNARLENEHRALSLLEEMGVGAQENLPRVAFWGYHNRLAIIGETAVDGIPLRDSTDFTSDCPYLLQTLDWFTMLASISADPEPATPAEVAVALNTLFTQFTDIYRLAPEHRAFLSNQLETVARSCQSFPLVFQHGDPGTWNAVVTPEDRVVFLDWEAAEPQGMPLWDLFYFMRSYSVGAARSLGTQDRLQGFAEQLLSDTSLSRLLISKVNAYRTQVGLHPTFVEPLFYTCWMHRALKESTRLAPSQLDAGHYVNLLHLCIESRDTITLSRLFSSGVGDTQDIHVSANGQGKGGIK